MTTLKLGYTNPLTDAFGAHPILGPVLDLNDGQVYTLVSPEGLEPPPPPRTLVPAGNVRTQGERILRAVYRRNREAVCRLVVGPPANYAALVASIRSLVRWLNAPPAVPLTIQYQPFGAASPVYLDVVGAAHDIPEDESEWLRLQFEPIEIVFVARPGLRGDRVTLQNLVVNPGFGQGSGPAVSVWQDTLATLNGYTSLVGAVPTLAANVLTIANGATIGFGSPSWGAVNQWQVRWQFATGLTASFYLHRVDANNSLRVDVASTTVKLIHRVAGVDSTLATGTVAALTNGNWYWLQVTQFPTVPSDPAYQTAALFADAAGAIGAAITGGSIAAPVADANAGVAQSGSCALAASGASLAIGGAFSNVHTLALFGPGSWSCTSAAGASPSPAPAATGPSAGGWDMATVFTGGPVNTPAAARLDAPPAGIWHAQWAQPAGTSASPVTPGGVYSAGMWLLASGVSGTCVQRLLAIEYTSGGAVVQTTILATHTGALAAWTQLSASWTLQGTTAFVALALDVYDTVVGASANQSVWADNCQLNTGATLQSYHELRFAQSPAQLVVSGLLGDLPAPALVQFGTFLASLAKGSTLSFAIGRWGQVSAGAILTSAAVGYYGTTVAPQATAALDAAGYGGYYALATVSTASWSPRPFSPRLADALGTFHLIERYRTADATPGGVQARVFLNETLDAWYTDALNLRSGAAYFGPYQNPLSAANTWTVSDAGQVALPTFMRGALRDDTQVYEVARAQGLGTTAGGAEGNVSWAALLPIDGSLLLGVVNYPSNNLVATITNQWLWAYFDGLLMNRAAAQDSPGWTYSLEGIAVPNPAHGFGGPGTANSGPININSGADPYLTLDPTLQIASASQFAGINQLVAYVADNNGTVLPFHGELQYSPLYLYPR